MKTSRIDKSVEDIIDDLKSQENNVDSHDKDILANEADANDNAVA